PTPDNNTPANNANLFGNGDDTNPDNETPVDPATITPPKPPPPPVITTRTSQEVRQKIEAGIRLIDNEQLVGGRDLLNQALAGPISSQDAAAVRKAMVNVNNALLFSPVIFEGDPQVAAHIVQQGEYLSTIAPKYDVPLTFIARINNIDNVHSIRAGRRLKVVRGPFHIVVDKSEFRLDVFLENLYVCSFPVGLGEHDSTPVGNFVVKRHSKLKDGVAWTNPRTGKVIPADAPDNPLGGYWIGLLGADDDSLQYTRYGLHGTIEPDSIGYESSMGCIRLLPDDIDLVYDMLAEQKSRVTIKP
ncbi:MAG: hypothetical protein CMJ49_14380, partial [Planctomycetaceae bacterium]|nr:hypothetical protein [Planctomycetaceae bacterium]